MTESAGSPDGAPTRSVPSRWIIAAACALTCAFIVQASIAARRDSVTIDEFVHLPLGLYNLYTGDFRADPINPPLARMIAALPLYLRPPAFDPEPDTPHWSMGYLLMQRNADRYQRIFVSARSMVIALAVLLAMLVFWWAGALYGWSAGLAALALYSFSPSMLAHGHLVTLDLGGALGFTMTAFATWRLLQKPSHARAALVGVALAIATLLKLSGFVLVAAVVLCVAVRALGERGGGSRMRWLALLCTSAAACLIALNLGYGCEGTFAPLSAATLDERGRIAMLAARAPWLRLPLPLPFINGVDMVLNVGKQSDPSYFFAGKLSSEGWWYYHLAAFALKTPIPLLLASVFALAMWAMGRGKARYEYCVYAPVLLIFASNSLFNSLQIGVRHVLPVYPLLMIGVSPWIVGGLARWNRPGGHGRMMAIAVAAGLLWYVGSSLAVAPRYLQYFNEVAGGAEGGHRFLVDSNVDWGQDLIRLREYMDANGIDQVNLAYFGRVHPGVYGIRFLPLERGRSRGITAVSATFLMGRPYFWFYEGRYGWVRSGTYTWLQSHTPIARVGSMFIYDLQPDAAS